MVENRMVFEAGKIVADAADMSDLTGDPFEKRLGKDLNTPASNVSVFRFNRVAQPEPVPAGPPDSHIHLLPTRLDPVRVWSGLTSMTINARHAARNRLIVQQRRDAVGSAFDMLRTRLAQTLHDFGWRRVAVTSPTRGCGKSFVAANLALSFSRKPGLRTLLLDLDLQHPALARMFGAEDAGDLRQLFDDAHPLESHLLRVAPSLAVGFQGVAAANASEVLQSPQTAERLASISATLAPDVMIYDLPPVLTGDDLIAFLPEVDGVLLVADGTQTIARDITECERLLEGRTQLLGIVLNRAEISGERRYIDPDA